MPAPTPEIADPLPDSAAEVSDPGETAVDGAITGDDPVAALHELVARRERCFRDLSVLCLDGVVEGGSAAQDADRAALQAVLDGGESPPRVQLSSATLVERLGDSALIELGADSDPASVLLLKGEAGWRIRDYLAPSGAERPGD